MLTSSGIWIIGQKFHYKILQNFFLFGTVNIRKDNDKSKHVCSGFGIAFGRKGVWNLGNDSARNAVSFGNDNSSSSHTDNPKNNFLVLSEGDTLSINKKLGAPEKKI